MREFLMSMATDFGRAWGTPWIHLLVREVFALALVFALIMCVAYVVVTVAMNLLELLLHPVREWLERRELLRSLYAAERKSRREK